MSQTYFSKLDSKEKKARLAQLSSSKGQVTVWEKGQRSKFSFPVVGHNLETDHMTVETKSAQVHSGAVYFCTFELKGMSFFSKVTLKKEGQSWQMNLIEDLFKAERRGSYRMLTYPIYQVYANFILPQDNQERSKVIDFRTKVSQTGLFKNFLKLLSQDESDTLVPQLKLRLQDLSATGMSVHIGELESGYFHKDMEFTDVSIHFKDEDILVPKLKVVYVIDLVTGEKAAKKFKVGFQFRELPSAVDEQLGRKINALLREIDSNKDFENFIK